MSIQPVRSMRVSTSMQTQMLLEQMRVNMLQMFNNQQQLATGQRLLTISDDPSGASRAMDLGAVLERQVQLQKNATFADGILSAADASLAEVRNVLNQASSLASQNVGVPADADQRTAAGAVVDGLISQLIAVANRQHQGIYLFAGQACDKPPFEEAVGGVLYKGDTHGLSVNIDGASPLTVSLPGDQVFGAISAEVRGWAPWMPQADATLRLSDLKGATGDGVRLGSVVIDEVGGAGPFSVDLSQASTMGDVVGAINAAAAAAGATVNAAITVTGLQLTAGGGVSLRVTDPGQGSTASDLGILRPTAVASPLNGLYVQPKVTASTLLDGLQLGGGIDKVGGLTITNGTQTANVDLSGAQTVQDVLNAINGTNLGVLARINDDATGIDVYSRLSGSRLSIGEAGGQTATDLGIRSMHRGTTLASLNDGQGVRTGAGADIRIVMYDGTTLDVNVDGAETLGDLIDSINAASTSVTASLAGSGNGIRLQDTSAGADTLRVERPNLSSALEDLGLNVASAAGELVGRDVSIVRPAGVFTALEDLRAALTGNDTPGITRAGTRISALLSGIGAAQGQVGALGQQVVAQQASLADAVTASKALLSDVQDADYTEVITRFTQAQTIMQANLMTGSKLMQMSLMDFLQ